MYVGVRELLPSVGRLPTPPCNDSMDERTPRFLPDVRSLMCDDRMDYSMSESSRSGPNAEVEVATTLASLSAVNLQALSLPTSPTYRYAGRSAGTLSSKSSSFSAPEPTTPELPALGGFQQQSPSNSGPQVTLPRLLELDMNLNLCYPHNSSEARRGSDAPTKSVKMESIETPYAYPRTFSSPTIPRDQLPSPPLSQRGRSPALHLPLVYPPIHPSQAYRPELPRMHQPVRRPRRPATGDRCNIKYTTEQVDFILYWNKNKGLAWKDVEDKFDAYFPSERISGHKRAVGGLQGVLYRKNKEIPLIDEHGLLMFDHSDNLVTMALKVRDQKKMTGDNAILGLLETHPERAIKYPWVERVDKQKIWRIGQDRERQLRDAELRKRKKTVLRRNSKL